MVSACKHQVEHWKWDCRPFCPNFTTRNLFVHVPSCRIACKCSELSLLESIERIPPVFFCWGFFDISLFLQAEGWCPWLMCPACEHHYLWLSLVWPLALLLFFWIRPQLRLLLIQVWLTGTSCHGAHTQIGPELPYRGTVWSCTFLPDALVPQWNRQYILLPLGFAWTVRRSLLFSGDSDLSAAP